MYVGFRVWFILYEGCLVISSECGVNKSIIWFWDKNRRLQIVTSKEIVLSHIELVICTVDHNIFIIGFHISNNTDDHINTQYSGRRSPLRNSFFSSRESI